VNSKYSQAFSENSRADATKISFENLVLDQSIEPTTASCPHKIHLTASNAVHSKSTFACTVVVVDHILTSPVFELAFQNLVNPPMYIIVGVFCGRMLLALLVFTDQ
jgi:hypothetical protein